MNNRKYLAYDKNKPDDGLFLVGTHSTLANRPKTENGNQYFVSEIISYLEAFLTPFENPC